MAYAFGNESALKEVPRSAISKWDTVGSPNYAHQRSMARATSRLSIAITVRYTWTNWKCIAEEIRLLTFEYIYGGFCHRYFPTLWQ